MSLKTPLEKKIAQLILMLSELLQLRSDFMLQVRLLQIAVLYFFETRDQKGKVRYFYYRLLFGH